MCDSKTSLDGKLKSKLGRPNVNFVKSKIAWLNASVSAFQPIVHI